MFEFINVRYGKVLDLPRLVIDAEQVTSLAGPSGSGKTTLLRLLNKMISPTSGQILFEGKDLSQRDSVRHRRDVIMLSQNPAIFEGTVGDNLRAASRFQEKEPPGDQILKRLLEQVNLTKPLDEAAGRLSGGERQRLALARVLLLAPRVFLLDEPSSALDEESEQRIFTMLTSQARETGRTIIMVTHSKAVARKYSDTIIKLSAGKCSEREELHA
jgi:putative ABC transport system ATP-binding protein